jgi:hypothetical protein
MALADLFPDAPRRPPQKLMHVHDVENESGTLLSMRCRAGHEHYVRCAPEGRQAKVDEHTVSEIRRGLPCPDCNGSAKP